MTKSLVLLSGEGTSIPQAEAKALFRAYDPESRFESPERRVLIADSRADPFVIGARVAFSRRVGLLIKDPEEARDIVAERKVRVRSYALREDAEVHDPGDLLADARYNIDLVTPDFEYTLVLGRRDYLALTMPGAMRQGWSKRRPRARPFFHPAAIFPKLSRALVNLSGLREGGLFLDPFCGTGSLAIEAYQAGAVVVASDSAQRMTGGALRNMKHFGQQWLGVVRADAYAHPALPVDAIATDLPYGRASSTRGEPAAHVTMKALESLPHLLRHGSKMVVMHPKGQSVSDGDEVSVEEEHDIYVHKFLTRTITILRRR